MQVSPNYSKLPDSFIYVPIKKFEDSHNFENIKNLYINDGFTSKYIAAKLGVSKTTVLQKLKELGVSKTTVHMGAASFGFKYHGGKIIVDPVEAKICRKISKLRDKGKSYRAIAVVFQLKQLKRRSGSTNWDHDFIRKTYINWTKNNEEKKR